MLLSDRSVEACVLGPHQETMDGNKLKELSHGHKHCY